MGLEAAKQMKIKNFHVSCYSLLIVNQVNGTYDAKDTKMIAYLSIVKNLQCNFESFTIQQVARENNTEDDALAGLGVVFKNVSLTTVPIIHVLKPSTEKIDDMMPIMTLHNNDNDQQSDMIPWTHIFKDYLTSRVQPQ